MTFEPFDARLQSKSTFDFIMCRILIDGGDGVESAIEFDEN